jgi:hypothetical protein
MCDCVLGNDQRCLFCNTLAVIAYSPIGAHVGTNAQLVSNILQLFEHNIILFLIEFTWSLSAGFGIAPLETFRGELATF